MHVVRGFRVSWSSFESAAGSTMLCEHEQPRMIRESHWSCCGRTDFSSQECTPLTEHMVPSFKSADHDGEWRDLRIQDWVGKWYVLCYGTLLNVESRWVVDVCSHEKKYH
jgi:hypothetical protein